MKRRLFVCYFLIFVFSATLPAYAGKAPAPGGKSSSQPASWWSPALPTLSATNVSNTGAPSWEDCLSAGEPASGPPAVGDCLTLSFQSSYSDPVNGSGPWLHLECTRAGADYQYEGQLSGSVILADSRAGFPGGWGYGVPFMRAGTAWHLGPANCTVELGHRSKSGKFMVDASTRFAVSG